MFEQISVDREVYGQGENLLRCGNALAMPEEIRALYGQAQCVYLDPPFMTGEKFMRRRPYGEQGWRTGIPAPRYPAYSDRYTGEKEYLRLLRRLIGAARELLNETGVFYLATVDGDRPRLRPLGAHLEMDGKVLFGVGDFKAVYRQLTVNPNCEIVACKKNGHWLRYSGRAVFETDEKYANAILDMLPDLRNVYNEATGNKMMVFRLEDAVALDIPVMGEGESLL